MGAVTGAGEQGWSAASVVVVGGGISGVACARALDAAGLDVVLLDRGRAIGGRMATRTLRAGRVVDVGASYVVARDERFADVVAAWRARGLATVWTDTFISSDDGHERTTKGPLRRGSPTGLRSLVADLASPLVVHRHEARTVTSTASEVLVDGRPARAAVLAMPDPQAKRLLAGGSVARAAVTGQPWEPVLALWAAWPRRWWPDLDGVFVNGSPLLSWVADDGRRQGDDAAVLVAHSTPDLARAHLDDPDAALPVLLDAVQSLLGGHDVPAPGEAGVVRWTYARPAEGRGLPYYLGDELVGVCGDGWGPRPAVEQAWLSGHLLGTELAARLP